MGIITKGQHQLGVIPLRDEIKPAGISRERPNGGLNRRGHQLSIVTRGQHEGGVNVRGQDQVVAITVG